MTRLHRKNATRRRGLTQEKVRHLLTGRDYFGGYGRDDKLRGTTFDEESARRDWKAAKVFLLAEFESYNPGRVPWASVVFDNVPQPDEQPAGFSRFKMDEILKQFPL